VKTNKICCEKPLSYYMSSTGNIQGNDRGCWLLACPVF